MRCREIDILMDAYFDRELQPASAAEVEAHLKACDRCHKRWGGLVALLTDPLPVQMPAGLCDRIMARVQEENTGHPARGMAPASRSVRWMRWYRYSGAMAACVAFFAFGWLISGWWSGSQQTVVEQPQASPSVTVVVSPWMLSSWAQAAAMPCPINPAMMLVQGVAPELMVSTASLSEPATRVRRRIRAMPSTQPAEPLSEPEMRVLPIVPRFLGA